MTFKALIISSLAVGGGVERKKEKREKKKEKVPRMWNTMNTMNKIKYSYILFRVSCHVSERGEGRDKDRDVDLKMPMKTTSRLCRRIFFSCVYYVRSKRSTVFIVVKEKETNGDG